ncbi:MAG: 4Fe-4S dicluster domain-containing protein [Deltaproteobacteria bacterium]|nr:4Fe-4S dicluster domain-containing protein [Deltaproteobacteria bacterium]MBW2220281.1 4Fe-4S dicluster domain-containing protein [Deltaproteobacteria bacterium]
MKVINIDKKDWAGGLEKSQDKYRLFGPVKDNKKGYSEFRELDKGKAPDMDASDSLLSPKSIAFPPSEVILEYTTDEKKEECNQMNVPEKDYSSRAVIGIRPYDAAAFLILKKNFDTSEYRDPYWCDSYEACTFVGLAANKPETTDFSTSTKSGPFDESGLDVLLVDDGKAYLAKVITDKGAAFLDAAGFNAGAGDDASDRIEKLKSKAEKAIQSTVSFDNIGKKSILELYESDLWEDIAFACINCGTCTYVCPTCWCFDIQDEASGNSGKRLKCWDSCMYPLFTVHTTGHNPRDTKVHRVRQRFMHKLKYYLDKYDDGIMCVGCGRCIRSCPVNIDIRNVCEKMNNN